MELYKELSVANLTDFMKALVFNGSQGDIHIGNCKVGDFWTTETTML